jgi:MFS family permease
LVEASVSETQPRRLFVASCMALTATAVTFAIRGDVLGDLRTAFSLSNEDLGKAAGAWAYGFTLSIFIGGQLVDALGMKRIVAAAFLMHVIGVVLTIFATGLWTLFAGTLCVGLGNGLV